MVIRMVLHHIHSSLLRSTSLHSAGSPRERSFASTRSGIAVAPPRTQVAAQGYHPAPRTENTERETCGWDREVAREEWGGGERRRAWEIETFTTTATFWEHHNEMPFLFGKQLTFSPKNTRKYLRPKQRHSMKSHPPLTNIQ